MSKVFFGKIFEVAQLLKSASRKWFLTIDPYKRAQKSSDNPKIDFLGVFPFLECSQTSDIGVIYSMAIFSKNHFFVPQVKKNILHYFGTSNFRKKFFFDLQNLMFQVVSGAQKSIPEHFFECSKYPSYHMSISQKIFWDSKNMVFGGSEGVKIQ